MINFDSHLLRRWVLCILISGFAASGCSVPTSECAQHAHEGSGQSPTQEQRTATSDWVWARYRFWMEEGHPGVLYTDFQGRPTDLDDPSWDFQAEMRKAGPGTVPALIEIAERRGCFDLAFGTIRQIDYSHGTRLSAEVLVHAETNPAFRDSAVDLAVAYPAWCLVDGLVQAAWDLSRPLAERQRAVAVLREIAEGLQKDRAALESYSSSISTRVKALRFRRGLPEAATLEGLLKAVEQLETATFGLLYEDAASTEDDEKGEGGAGWQYRAHSAVLGRELLQEVLGSPSATVGQRTWAEARLLALKDVMDAYLARHLSCGICPTAILYIGEAGGPPAPAPFPATHAEWEQVRLGRLEWLRAQREDVQERIKRGYVERLAGL